MVLSVVFSLMVKDPAREDDGSLAQAGGAKNKKKSKRESIGTSNNHIFCLYFIWMEKISRVFRENFANFTFFFTKVHFGKK